MTRPRVILLAGEASGDQHGAHLARALRAQWPHARLEGLGGPRMAAEGVHLWERLDRLAVMGFAEIIGRLPFFWGLERRIKSELKTGIDLVIPIDYPGFNLRIARAASQRDIPVLYYIAPQVWAWRPSRTETLAEITRGIAAILPFEKEVFRASGAHVRFVGHPLLEEPVDDIAWEDFCDRHGLDAQGSILALFPGSRIQEVDRHLPVFLRAARKLVVAFPGLQVVLSKAPEISELRLRQVDSLGVVNAYVKDSRTLLRHSRAAIIKSGTSTLEAAIEGVPFVTVYRTSPLTYALAKRLVRVKYIALANLVVGRRVVAELIQGSATAERIAQEVSPLLEVGGKARCQVIRGLEEVQEALGEPGASERVAAWAREILGT